MRADRSGSDLVPGSGPDCGRKSAVSLAALFETHPAPADLPDAIAKPPDRLAADPCAGVARSLPHRGLDFLVRRQALHLARLLQSVIQAQFRVHVVIIQVQAPDRLVLP